MARVFQSILQRKGELSVTLLLIVGGFICGRWEGQRECLEAPPSALNTEATSSLHPAPANTRSNQAFPFSPGLATTPLSGIANQAKPAPSMWGSYQGREHQFSGPPQPRSPLQEPPPLKIPANATPQQTAFLTARDQLIRDQISFINQHKADDPTTRQLAMQQWRQQNSARIQQLRQMSQSLAQSNTVSTSQNPTTVHP